MSSKALVRFGIVSLALVGAACSNGQSFVPADGGAGSGGAGGKGGTGGVAGHVGSGGQGAGGTGATAGTHGTGGAAGAGGTVGTGGGGGTGGSGTGGAGTGGSGTGGAGTGGTGGTAVTCGGSTPKKCDTAGICVASSGCCADTDCPTNAGGQTGTCDTGTHMCNYACSGSTKSCTSGGTTVCIPTSGCCTNSDCTGNCMMCNASSHACVAAKSMDDPNGRCVGTCDASGACKARQGQMCSAVSGGCISGTTCSVDGYCCNVSCGGNGNCAGSCASGTCAYPTGTCGSGPTCSGTKYVGQGTCSAGSCVSPAAQPCQNDFICSANACKTSCAADGDCASGYCESGSCHLPATAITAGYDHTCVLLSDGSIRCWGDNTMGQLGTGMVTTTGIGGSATPVSVTGLPLPAVSVVAGSMFTCAILNDGSVWCWGDNSYGQLGKTSITGSPTPVKVSLSGAVSAISCGQFFACAIVSGTVYCWGGDGEGELGDGMLRGSSGGQTWTATPQKVMGLSGVSIIASGAGHTCAAAGGAVSCWGHDQWGQLGNNMTTPSGAGYGFDTPQPIDYSASAVALTAGDEHTCMIDTSNYLYCWGENDNGAVGDNNSSGQSVLIPTYISNNIMAPIAVTAGGNHTCAINLGGAVVCWGYSLYGQLGDDATGFQWLPEPVIGLNGSATALALGEDHTCAIIKNGSVFCWGADFSGELGNGNVNGGATPVQVVGW